MHLAFFGSSLVSAYWNGAATYYRGILKALHARGHTATFYEPDAYGRQSHVDRPDPPYARDVPHSPQLAASGLPRKSNPHRRQRGSSPTTRPRRPRNARATPARAMRPISANAIMPAI